MINNDENEWVDVVVGPVNAVGTNLFVQISPRLSPTFWAFRDALVYCAHKYHHSLCGESS